MDSPWEADKVRRHGLMRLGVKPTSVTLWQCTQNPHEEDKHQGEDDEVEASGETPDDEPEAARDTEVGVEESEHQAARRPLLPLG